MDRFDWFMCGAMGVLVSVIFSVDYMVPDPIPCHAEADEPISIAGDPIHPVLFLHDGIWGYTHPWLGHNRVRYTYSLRTWKDLDWYAPNLEVRAMVPTVGWLRVGGATDITGPDGYPDNIPGHVLDLLLFTDWFYEGKVTYLDYLEFLEQWYIDSAAQEEYP